MTQYPANLIVFSDGGSVCHLISGFMAGRLEAHETLAVALAYAGYQIAQGGNGEPWPRVGGELVEFALGLAAARWLG